MATAIATDMRAFTPLDPVVLESICGGSDDDPLGPTALVDGRPQTCRALLARRDELFAHADDKSIPNDVWLKRFWKLDNAFMRLPSLKGCPPAKDP